MDQTSGDTRTVQLIKIYHSKQFLYYVFCGITSTTFQLVSRVILNFYTSFTLAIFLAYLIGFVTAFCLTRHFVFASRSRPFVQQAILFAAAYMSFLPVTWGLSIAAEPFLAPLLPDEIARFFAHGLGVAAPVVLNFAFNKKVTFKTVPALERGATLLVSRSMSPLHDLTRLASADAPNRTQARARTSCGSQFAE